MQKIDIYTDGACSGNPGKGGWGAVLISGNRDMKISGYNPHTTNNQMELQAVIEALQKIKAKDAEINIYTDSKYVMDGITKWIFNWHKNNWKTSTKKPVKNKELWQELWYLVCDKFAKKISWHWVKGHSDNELNNLADSLATGEIEKNR